MIEIKRYKTLIFWLAFCVALLGFFFIFVLNLPMSILARFSVWAKILSGKITVWGVKSLRFFQPWWRGSFQFNIPKDVQNYKRGALFVANHRSHLDVFILLEQIPGMRVLTKNLIFWIPGLGLAAVILRMIYIKRGVGQSYWKAMEVIKKGLLNKDRVLVFPEMTRSPFGKIELGRFTLGPFQKAIQTKTCVVPVVIWGSDYIWPKEEFALASSGPLIVETLSPLQSEDFSSAEALADKVRGLIQDRLFELSKSHPYEFM